MLCCSFFFFLILMSTYSFMHPFNHLSGAWPPATQFICCPLIPLSFIYSYGTKWGQKTVYFYPHHVCGDRAGKLHNKSGNTEFWKQIRGNICLKSKPAVSATFIYAVCCCACARRQLWICCFVCVGFVFVRENPTCTWTAVSLSLTQKYFFSLSILEEWFPPHLYSHVECFLREWEHSDLDLG